MRAVMIDGYGDADALHVRDVPDPSPGNGQVLIRVKAAGVNPVDWKIRRGDIRPFLPRSFPFIPGGDVAGVVEAVGANVTHFAVGDPVFALVGAGTGGGYAELAVAKQADVARKPEAWSFLEAASVPIAGLTALQALRDLGKLQAGQSVFVNGAAGGVGHFAVPIARALGASVAASCGARNLAFVRELGAEPVLDYTRDDFTTQSATYDIILDAVGTRSFPDCRMVLKPSGVYVSTLPTASVFFWSAAQSVRFGARQSAKFIWVKASGSDLAYLAELADQGKLRPTIDHVYPLTQVAAAHLASEGGHTRGKIVLET